MTEARRVAVVIGTRAQLIKMAPVLRELERQNIPFSLLMTGQHLVTMDELMEEFNVKTEPQWLCGREEIKRILQAPLWFCRALWRLYASRNDWTGKHTLVLVHGDTLSTFIGALVGRLVAGGRVGHVEAGLRSFDMLNPFPEELIRVIVCRLAHVHYAPGAWAAANLKGRRNVVDTAGNTILDTLRLTLEDMPSQNEEPPYVVVSIHRLENLYSATRLGLIVEEVERISRTHPVRFVLHPATERRLAAAGHLGKLQTHPNVVLLPRMTYRPFIHMAARARLVITDGGSNQEELYYLGVPTLLMREKTERQEGMTDGCTRLGSFDRTAIRAYVDDVLGRDPAPRAPLPDYYPARCIVDNVARFAMNH
ncbi:MAG: UDP-N-acetylglucosamine 2-epimerase [Ectothiorhodospiraceae bacterium]|nr:UDP-N-acetylglucosamine 2-epimerase [Ectothiorhodospiraceae bacterium]